MIQPWMIDDPTWMIDDPTWMIDDPTWMIDDPTWMIDDPTPTPSNSGMADGWKSPKMTSAPQGAPAFVSGRRHPNAASSESRPPAIV
jgi:hypothetical protein